MSEGSAAAFLALVKAWVTASGYGGVPPPGLGREHEALVRERHPGVVRQPELHRLQRLELGQGAGIDGHPTDARARLRRLDARTAGRGDHRFVDGQPAIVPVDVRPAQGARLAPPRPGRRDDPEQRRVPRVERPWRRTVVAGPPRASGPAPARASRSASTWAARCQPPGWGACWRSTCVPSGRLG